MFIPSTLCVIVSWTSFWIKEKVSDVRSAPIFTESILFVRLGPIIEPGIVENLQKLDSAPARVTCGILTFLAISAWTQAFNAELPKVSYIKAIDVWTVTCNLFVFLSLMEYAFAQGLVHISKMFSLREPSSPDFGKKFMVLTG